MAIFRACSAVPVPPAALFAWHARPGALVRLLPPWQPVRVRTPGELRDGARAELEIGPGPVAIRWVAEHRDVEPGVRFRDAQVKGPFARWVHTHACLPDPNHPGGSLLDDHVDYELPGGGAARAALGSTVRAELNRMFRFRHRRTRDDLIRHRNESASPMRVAITGATGLIGTALTAFLRGAGHEVRRITRRPAEPGDIAWRPAEGEIDADALRGLDAVVHLAGESPFALHWSDARKHAIRESRVAATRLLAETLAALPGAPRALLCASAIGYYGDRGGALLDETAASGDGFLAEVCRGWEAAADPARAAGLRVAHVRTGVVLAGRGGALGAMQIPFSLALGGPIGDGRQITSWIALDDVVAVYAFLLTRPDLSGAFNATAPKPVTNEAFTHALAQVLERPARLRVPRLVLRTLLGELADEMLLASARVAPVRLEQAGYGFTFPELEPALRMELGCLRREDVDVHIEHG